MKIRQKLVLLVFLIFFMGIMNVTLTSIVSNIQKQDGLLINIAGRQRMLSQKISKDVFVLACADEIKNTDKEAIITDLKNSSLLFDQTMKGFSDGGMITTTDGKKQNISKLTIDKKLIDQAIAEWTPFYAALNTYMSNTDETSMSYIRDHNTKLLSISNDITVALQNQNESKLQMQFDLQLIIVFLSLIVFVFVLVIVQRDIIKPIYSLVESTRAVANGNLSRKLKGNFKGEYHILASNFNLMTDNLKNSVSDTLDVFKELYEKSRKLSEDSVVISQGSKEITQAIESIATGSEEQADEVSKTVDITKDLSQILDEMNQYVDKTRESVEVMGHNTDKSKDTILKLQEVLETNETEYRKIDEDIFKLSEKSNVIGSILETISNIAEQTNLLSLNATIEAARAGEHGKGFAIVAAEVKKLADESQKSTEQIQEIIQNIVNVIGNASDSIKVMDQSMKETKAVMLETRAALEKIENSISIVQDNAVIEEQTIGVIGEIKTKVVSSIDTIMSTIERSSAAAEEINATTVQEDLSIQNLTGTIEEFHEVAKRFEEANDKFQFTE